MKRILLALIAAGAAAGALHALLSGSGPGAIWVRGFLRAISGGRI
jgi:hypothetical protein